MTAIVGIRCKDGVVIGADSSATFTDGGQVRTIEQPTEKKIEIIGDKVIVAGTGSVGHGQRFCAVVRKLHQVVQVGRSLSISCPR
jgi:20S proteasome alpha/beta subunit